MLDRDNLRWAVDGLVSGLWTCLRARVGILAVIEEALQLFTDLGRRLVVTHFLGVLGSDGDGVDTLRVRREIGAD